MSNEIWLNDRFVPYEEATVPIDDRGFQFSESVYEVIHVYAGRPFEMERHLRRLKNGLDALDIDLEMTLEELAGKSMEVVHRNKLQDAAIYIQVTAGAAPRIHLRPKELRPNLIVIASPAAPASSEWPDSGINCVTVSDDRWGGCYIKTTMLLPNTTAKRRAVAAGYSDAIFVRDGYAVESTASNLFAVLDGALWTTPASNYILRGITREVVLELAHDAGIPVNEAPIPMHRLFTASELFVTGSGVELVCITSVDGKQIGTGRPGPVIKTLRDAFRKRTLAR